MNTVTLDPILSLAIHGAFTNAVSDERILATEWLRMADRRLVSLYGDLANVPVEIWQITCDILETDYPVLASGLVGTVLREWATL
jgi:hypothetical protein